MITLFMPLAEGHCITKNALASLLAQTVDINIIPCVSKGVINHADYTDRLQEKVESEVINRNKISEIIKALNITDKYIIMQDRDVVHLRNNNIERSIAFLDENEDYAGVALPQTHSFDVLGHIVIQCVIFRTSFIRNFKFRALPELHTCDSTKKDILALGHKYGYLSNEILILDNDCIQTISA
jgi:hypothetical protein